MALAGTRKAGSQECWDIKNIEEQSMVTEYIKGIMQKHNLHTETSPTFNKIAGKVEHICTPLTAISRTLSPPDTLSAILHDLSPTPALCGTPREVALEIINENEHFKRGCYGGFCGPYRSPSDFTFYVNLRSALTEESAMSLLRVAESHSFQSLKQNGRRLKSNRPLFSTQFILKTDHAYDMSMDA